VHQLQQRDTAARIQYCHWFRRFVREGVHVLLLGLRFKSNTLYKIKSKNPCLACL
jgi:hypothetical protein